MKGMKLGIDGSVDYDSSYIDSVRSIAEGYFRYSGYCRKCDCYVFDGMGISDDIGLKFFDCPSCGYRNLLVVPV